MQSFTSQSFGVVVPLGENLDFLVRWDLTFKGTGVKVGPLKDLIFRWRHDLKTGSAIQF